MTNTFHRSIIGSVLVATSCIYLPTTALRTCNGVNCQTTWDQECCSTSQGRSMGSMANWRFGSIFRNSIPPPRPYNPPSFEEIFEKDPSSDDIDVMSSTQHKINLSLDPLKKFGIHQKQMNQLSNFGGFTEVDRNSDMSDFSKQLDIIKHRNHEMLFGNKYTTTPAPRNYIRKVTRKPMTTTTARTTQNFSNKFVQRTKKYPNQNKSDSGSKKKESSYKEKLSYRTRKKPKRVLKLKTTKFPSQAKEEDQPFNVMSLKTTFSPLKLKKKEDITKPKAERKQYDIKQRFKEKLKFTGTKYQTIFKPKVPRKTLKSAKKEVDVKKDNSNEYEKKIKDQMKKKLAEKKLKLAKEMLKRSKQRAYQKKLEMMKNAKLSEVSGLNFLDKSEETVIHKQITPKQKHKNLIATKLDSLRASQKQQLLKKLQEQETDENEIENDITPMSPVAKHKLDGKKKPFSRELCAKLRVPCRFVTEHPCCKMPQDIHMVARARAMDGSADLRWRFHEQRPSQQLPQTALNVDGEPRNGPQGRMISGLFDKPSYSRPHHTSFSIKSSNRIPYNHAWSKNVVTVPRYHLNGGPEETSRILSQCWRLTYLSCRTRKDMSHPCCSLTNKTRSQKKMQNALPPSNRLDRWLSGVY